MADGEVRAQDLAQETASTLSGNEQFVMFDSTAGKRADIDDVATYVAGDKTTLKTTNKTSPVAAINENFDAIADVKEEFSENAIILPFANFDDNVTRNDILFKKSGTYTVHVSGTAKSTGTTSDNIIYTTDGVFPNGTALSDFEQFVVLISVNGTINTNDVYVEMLKKDIDHVNWYGTTNIKQDTIIVPSAWTDILFRIRVAQSAVVDGNITIKIMNRIGNYKRTFESDLFAMRQDALYGANLNTIIAPGSYLMSSNYAYTNSPIASNLVGYLNVFAPKENRILQVVICHTAITERVYIRSSLDKGVTWNAWVGIQGGTNNYYTNNYSFPEYSNTYDISVSPIITTDTNAYLAPTGSTADRTAEIVAMLNSYGVCRLGKGDYYVNNLEMPTGTMIVGAGHLTRIILSGSSDGYAIKMTDYTIVKDCYICGSTSSITLSSTVGGRHGILWQGNFTEEEVAGNQPKQSIISNVYFSGFNGGAITCYDTGYGTFNCLEVTNVYANNCNVGINISYWSEFHKFTNVRTPSCYYGCINNGGNNAFINCDFSTCKVGFLMDNSTGQSPNNSHGHCVGCVFNHTDSNTGIGIKILNCDNGFIFDSCQIFFSQIYIEDSEGVVVSNSNFGTNNCNITISDGGVVLFANNLHGGLPTINISDNNNVHFVNCYVRSTGAVVSA